ncbi:FAD/NAD(P)-binding domain-containing protein [Amylostereum chailletii]|nr:FAD/NAD(P)-binding domain-containing protein [Amylostereum chailletii]
MALSTQKKNIVIVGGGIAGCHAAQTLSKKIDPVRHTLTLINARPFFLPLPVTVRMTTTAEGKIEDSAFVPYNKLLAPGRGTVRIARVSFVDVKEGATSGSLILTDSERLPFDILVLAPGNTWSGPLDFPDSAEDIQAHLATWRKKFKDASKVVMVGGGAVGFEFAGEIKQFYPEKKTTVVHSLPLPLSDVFPDKFRKRVEKDFRAADVEIVFNDSVDQLDAKDKKVVPTRSGRQLEGDLIVPTFGGKPATGFLTSLGDGVLTARGHIRVKPTLQLPTFPTIFAIGDAIDWNESRQVPQADAHAEVAAANVLNLLAGHAPSKEYKGSRKVIIITNGKYRGIGYLGFLWGIIVGNWICSLLKGRSLLLGMIRKRLGQPA